MYWRCVELFIGLRYLRAKRRSRFVSFISLISIAGIALGIMALIVITSVMNGFQAEIRTRILGTTAHIKVAGDHGPLGEWRSVLEQIKTLPGIIHTAPYIDSEAMIIQREFVSAALVQGVIPSFETGVSHLGDKMMEGEITNLKSGEYRIILGIDLARNLNAQLGDKIVLVNPQAMLTPIGLVPRVKKFTVAGIFRVGMYEYDSALALIHLDDSAKFNRFQTRISGLRVAVDKVFNAPQIRRNLQAQLPQHKVTDWTEENVNFFHALKVEKVVMFVILTLIILVAVFNVVSNLVMMVTEKQGDIAILRTLGLSPLSIMVIFMIQGLMVGFIGSLLGLLSGVLIALNIDILVPLIEYLSGIKFFSEDIYYINYVPSLMYWDDVIDIGIVAFVLTIIATLYPAFNAAKTKPAQVLRYDW